MKIYYFEFYFFKLAKKMQKFSFQWYQPVGRAQYPWVKEVAKIDYQVLQKLKIQPNHLNKSVPATEYLKNLTLKHLIPRLRFTQHLCERLKSYIDYHNGYYVELYQPEYETITNLIELKKLIHQASVVEVGFNQKRQVCKIGLVMPCHGRFLFICLGMDGGIKTCYMTPKFKHRNQYASQSGEFLNVEQFIQFMSA